MQKRKRIKTKNMAGKEAPPEQVQEEGWVPIATAAKACGVKNYVVRSLVKKGNLKKSVVDGKKKGGVLVLLDEVKEAVSKKATAKTVRKAKTSTKERLKDEGVEKVSKEACDSPCKLGDVLLHPYASVEAAHYAMLEEMCKELVVAAIPFDHLEVNAYANGERVYHCKRAFNGIDRRWKVTKTDEFFTYGLDINGKPLSFRNTAVLELLDSGCLRLLRSEDLQDASDPTKNGTKRVGTTKTPNAKQRSSRSKKKETPNSSGSRPREKSRSRGTEPGKKVKSSVRSTGRGRLPAKKAKTTGKGKRR